MLGPVSLLCDPFDDATARAPVRWAIGRLEDSLAVRQMRVVSRSRLEDVPAGEPSIVIAGVHAPQAGRLLAGAGVSLPDAPEALALVPGRLDGRNVVLATGQDTRGLVYAVLELTDRVATAADPLAALRLPAPVVEQPANRIRSVMRLFASDVEDTGWFHDRDFWRGYLSMLAAQRFNRFNLALGLGYDFPRGIRDAYFYFSYPFLVAVPGYHVRVRELPDDARERNLESLRFIAEETAARGLHFQLGLWTHAYEMQDSPDVNYTVDGLTPETHAAYCRDALRTLLSACPAIGGVTLRIHGESGVPERSYDFWQTVFRGIAECGRRVEIDLHAKGIDQRMIDLALETGQPVLVSPKYWAEHLGLPYHQAEIRPLERPGPVEGGRGEFMALSGGERRFTRYGYADLLREDRRYGVLHRVWPGTQRLLLWGDPVFAAGYGRAARFAGSDGMEFFEPLSFKGRKGSGWTGNPEAADGEGDGGRRGPGAAPASRSGSRTGYAEAALVPAADWEKYAYTYRLWGRLLYNPQADPDTWQRGLRTELGPAAGAAADALAHASRLLPLVTTAHLPSAANYGFWAELPANMPIVDEQRPHPYSDTPAPKRFGTVSPLDPQLFSSVDDYARELMSGEPSGKYSPLTVAQWLEAYAGRAERYLAEAELVADRGSPAFRRLAVDVRIQIGVGRYYAAKLRAGVAYTLYVRTGDVEVLRTALDDYRRARDAWAAAAAAGTGVYVNDLTFGPVKHLRGHWSDRLPAIDADIDDMAVALERAQRADAPTPGDGAAAAAVARWRAAVRATQDGPDRPGGRDDTVGLDRDHGWLAIEHVPPAHFQPGAPLPIALRVRVEAPGKAPEAPDALAVPAAVRLRYRRLNQAETWQTGEMMPAAGKSRGDNGGSAGISYHGEIPAHYTNSPYALQYFVEVRTGAAVTHWPGLGADLSSQPYVVVRPPASGRQ